MRPIIFAIFCLSPVLSKAQYSLFQYFDGNDTLEYETLSIHMDTTNSNNIWQIGIPQKGVFNSASTIPNALITDTVFPYPVNDTSRFELSFTEEFLEELEYGGIFALEWIQKLDLDYKHDGGVVEFSLDSGNSWLGIEGNPYVYNFYGYEFENFDLVGTTLAFTGTDSTWRNIWFCLDADWLWSYGTDGFRVRFSLIADSTQTYHDGWMIDNMIAHITWVHTVGEKQSEKYLNVYPNPSNGRIHIEAAKQRSFHITEKLEVFDVNGKRIRYFENIPTKFFIDLNDEPDGSYFVRVQTNMKTETVPITLLRAK